MPMRDLKAKNISWFGNMRQKFETLCYEVDNIVSQGTVKSVENHVQSVGQSMKRFCSDVVQDLVPPFVAPVPPEVDVEHQSRNSPVNTLFKSMVGVEKHIGCTVRKHQSSMVPYDSDPSRHQSCHPVNQFAPGDSATHVMQKEYGSATEKLGNVSAKIDSAKGNAEENDMKTKFLESELMGVNSSTEKETFEGLFSSIPSTCDSENTDAGQKEDSLQTVIHGQQLPPEDDSIADENNTANENGILGLEEDEMCNKSSPVEVLELSTSGIKDLCKGPSSSEGTACGCKNRIGIGDEYSTAALCDRERLESVQEARTICESPSDDCSTVPMSEVGISVSSSGEKFMEIDSLSSMSHGLTELHSFSDTYANSIIQSEQLSSGNPDEDLSFAAFSPAVSFNGRAAQKGFGFLYSALSSESLGYSVGANCVTGNLNDSEMETIDLHDKLKLEDSCVVVDDKMLHEVSRRTRKLRSLKEKIQDVFSPQKQLRKDYETLAIWFGDSDMESKQHVTQTHPSSSSTLGDKHVQHIHEPEWEFL